MPGGARPGSPAIVRFNALHCHQGAASFEDLPALAICGTARRHFSHNYLARAQVLLDQKPDSSNAARHTILHHIVFRSAGAGQTYFVYADSPQHGWLCQRESKRRRALGLNNVMERVNPEGVSERSAPPRSAARR